MIPFLCCFQNSFDLLEKHRPEGMAWPTRQARAWPTRQARAWHGLCPCEAQTNKKTYYNLCRQQKRLRTGFVSCLSRFALERVGVRRWARPACTAACTAATAEEGVTRPPASGRYWYVLIAIHNSGVNGMLRSHDFKVVMPL
jgi:hypothetical protein